MGFGRDRAEQLATVQAAARAQSTATVLLHAAVAKRLGLSAGDHKVLDLVVRRGRMTAGEVARLTGLTTGAVTAMVDRLEKRGFVRRERDPADRRVVNIVPAPESFGEVAAVFAALSAGMEALLSRYDEAELAAISDFLVCSGELLETEAERLGREVVEPQK